MILTFEVDKTGTLLDVHFDAEGREQLIGILTDLCRPGEHKHLTRVPNVDRPARNVLSDQRFDKGSKAIEDVTLVYLSPREKPLEGIE